MKLRGHHDSAFAVQFILGRHSLQVKFRRQVKPPFTEMARVDIGLAVRSLSWERQSPDWRIASTPIGRLAFPGFNFDSKSALSIPKSAGWRGRYKTVLVHGFCSGRPFFGRAVFGPIEIEAASLPSGLTFPLPAISMLF